MNSEKVEVKSEKSRVSKKKRLAVPTSFATHFLLFTSSDRLLVHARDGRASSHMPRYKDSLWGTKIRHSEKGGGNSPHEKSPVS